MKASDVVGRKIVRVIQEKFWNDHIGRWSVDVKGFVLDNGAIVSFSTTETGSDYATSASVWKPEKKKEDGSEDLRRKAPEARRPGAVHDGRVDRAPDGRAD